PQGAQMSDQNEENGPRIIPPPPATARQPLLTETFDILPNPTADELIRLMARLANFLNLLAAESLRSRVVTAAQPAPMSMLNAAATLEQGAMGQRQYLAMM